MARLSKTWLTAAGAAALLAAVFVSLALLLYERTERGVVEKHSQDPQLLAELAAPLRTLAEKEWEAALPRIPALAPEGNVFLLAADGRLYFRESPRDFDSLEAAVLPWRGAAGPGVT